MRDNHGKSFSGRKKQIGDCLILLTESLTVDAAVLISIQKIIFRRLSFKMISS